MREDSAYEWRIWRLQTQTHRVFDKQERSERSERSEREAMSGEDLFDSIPTDNESLRMLFDIIIRGYENNEERMSKAAQLNASLTEMQHKSECICVRLSGAHTAERMSLRTLCIGLNACIADFHRMVGAEY